LLPSCNIPIHSVPSRYISSIRSNPATYLYFVPILRHPNAFSLIPPHPFILLPSHVILIQSTPSH
jgi:hypothetical protein